MVSFLGMVFPLETQFVRDAQQLVFSTSWMVPFAILLARWLILTNVIAVGILLGSCSREDRHAVYEAMWSLALALILTSLIAHFVGRARPYLASADVRLLIPPPFNTSFPSGHTASAVALGLAFFRRNRILGALSLLVAAFVAFGRVLVGVHYPTDLLGGMCVGLLSFGIVRWTSHALNRRDIVRSAAHHHHNA